MTSQLPTNTALKCSILQQYWVFIGSDRNTKVFITDGYDILKTANLWVLDSFKQGKFWHQNCIFFTPTLYTCMLFFYCFFHSSATRFVWKPKTKWSSTGKWSEVFGNKIWNQLLRTNLILYITRLSVFYLQ